MPLHRCSVLLLLLLQQLTALAQQQDGIDKAIGLPAAFFSKFSKKVDQKIDHLDQQLTRQTERYLNKLAKQEKRLQRKLSKIDSNAAKNFGDVNAQYAALTNKIKSPSLNNTGLGGQYLPNVDSLQTGLSFLDQNSQLLASSKQLTGKLQHSLGGLQQLQGKLQTSEQVKQFIRQRKELMRQTISRYKHLPNSITKSFQQYNKDFYYYSQQVREYKELLNDPSKWEQKALELLNQLPAFQNFMKQNSQLAGLFSLPGNYGSAQSLAGLQTRAQTQALIQNQLASAGPNAQAMLQQNLQSAQAQLNKLKDQVLNSPSTGELVPMNREGWGEAELPDFKPNNQKTKSFWKRLEYGTNMQTAKSSSFFPTTTDLGLSVGYKINDKSTIGIGGSYKVGWGKDIRHIAITSEGASLRSFFDVKLKGNFYASGGFEYNYQPTPALLSAGGDLLHANDWQESGLVGISKIVSLKSKLFKKTKVQLLLDFLSYQQTPRTQPVKFRVAYAF